MWIPGNAKGATTEGSDEGTKGFQRLLDTMVVETVILANSLDDPWSLKETKRKNQ